MKKSLLALAVLGAFASAAQAQSSVTLYGLVDAGVIGLSHVTTGGGGNSAYLMGAAEASNRWGIKGSEDLGGGLKSTFALENGFNLVTGGLKMTQAPLLENKLFDRGANVGLAGGFGSFTAGRNWTPFALSQVAVDSNFFSNFGSLNSVNTSARNTSNVAGGNAAYMGFFTDSSIVYNTPNLAGFTGSAMYGFGGGVGDIRSKRVISFSAAYANGPLTVAMGYLDSKDATTYYTASAAVPVNTSAAAIAGAQALYVIPAGINNDSSVLRDYHLGAKYNFGPVIASLDWSKYKNPSQANLANNTFYNAGVAVPLGSSMVAYADWTHRKDINDSNFNADAAKIALDYNFSKTTTAYVDLGVARNKSASTVPMGISVANVAYNLGTTALGSGQNQTAFAFGVRKIF